jgi:large subunit ribosomal protein L15
MVKLNTIQPARGTHKRAKRVGRGTGSGWGCTAGRGSNGYGARRGSHTKPYFEGGQTPLSRRIPKRGFHNPFKKVFQIVNVRDLENLSVESGEVTVQTLYDNGLIHSRTAPVKILGTGELSKSYTVIANAFSKTAIEKIEHAKGKAEVAKSA